MTQHGDIDDVWIPRIDDDAGDRLRILQAHPGECFACVCRFIDAIAEARALPVIRFPRSNPDDIWIGRRDGDITDRSRRVSIKNWGERRPVVCRFPNSASRRPDVADVRVAVDAGYVLDAPTHAGRSDAAEDKSLQRRIV